ncbi:cation:proton antiporter [Acetobacter sp. TBRC 12305]|uniref:Cation:proton antiporter n=1 Tax=Acetobacter garciniae TaxID=2817435 RepID=A0A939HR46_9PROT|nr:cation:proton antiporter [Acetobacter garciniae]MBO1326071.1 cation:proton antiporter [Acetobacter garciniae]MBX0345185.1 cation:proton antiporter [Acetobacter garciniae]
MHPSNALYLEVLTGLGVIILLTAWLPMVLRRMPLSLPIVCVGAGAALMGLPDLRPLAVHPLAYPHTTERLSELVVIVSLMGAGLKIDRLLGVRRWMLTWRLLGIAMPLTIVLLAILAHRLLGLGAAAALLIGSSLAPTDPVLAADVQVGAPGEGLEDEARFALTSEAGLNDSLAFPFVNLAIVLAGVDYSMGDLGPWLTHDVVWKLFAGVAMGYLIGRVLGYLTFHLPSRAKLSRTGDGFVALGATCLAYGLTQLVDGYGFLAVFIAALGLRHASRDDSYHRRLHAFAEEVERLLMMLLLIAFGGMIAYGGLLGATDWRVVLFAVLTLLVVRPVAGMLSLWGAPLPWWEKLVISFFGIRGMGSIYYLAFALDQASFTDPARLWSVIGWIVLISIVLHGITVTPALRVLDRWQRMRRR